MKSLAVVACALAATTFGPVLGSTGAALAAPAGPVSPSQTVNALRAQGYHVVVNTVGGGSLDGCTVKAVRPGQTFSRTDSGVPGAMDDLRTTVTAKTVYVDVAC
jgi:ABC-type taurine transport system substrate-binding protein